MEGTKFVHVICDKCGAIEHVLSPWEGLTSKDFCGCEDGGLREIEEEATADQVVQSILPAYAAAIEQVTHLGSQYVGEMGKRREADERMQKERWEQEDKRYDRDTKTTTSKRAWALIIFVLTSLGAGGGAISGHFTAEEGTSPLRRKVWVLENTPSTLREVTKEELGDKMEAARKDGGVVEVTEEDLKRIRDLAVERLREKAEKEFDEAFTPEQRMLDPSSIQQQIQMPDGVRLQVKKGR